jgi:hypothetical protein
MATLFTSPEAPVHIEESVRPPQWESHTSDLVMENKNPAEGSILKKPAQPVQDDPGDDPEAG